MRNRLLVSLLFAACSTSGCHRAAAGAEVSDLEVMPNYTPMIRGMPGVPPCVGLSKLTVADARQDPSVIGYRFHEDSPQDREAIRMGRTLDWVKDGVESSLARASVSTALNGKGELRVTVNKLDVEEKTYSNSEYDARMVLDFALIRPGTAEQCWTGRTEGFAENYGQAESMENLRETANHSLDRAVELLLVNQGFLDAACGECMGTAPSATTL
jgi:hypothetical protein